MENRPIPLEKASRRPEYTYRIAAVLFALILLLTWISA